MLSSSKFKRHEKGSIMFVQICRQSITSQMALQSKPQIYCSLQIASFNACRPCGFIQRQAFMTAFINGMFCRSLRCELFTKYREEKATCHPKGMPECYYISSFRNVACTGQAVSYQDKWMLLTMVELRPHCSLKFTDRSHSSHHKKQSLNCKLNVVFKTYVVRS